MLLANLNPKSDRLFQMPTRGRKANIAAAPLFNGLPFGKNTIATMMKSISEKAGLSQQYTNHCVRATAIQTLVDANVSELAIMGTTGHHQVQSLSSYASRSRESRVKWHQF